jgi:hypothetical protein
VKGSNNRKKQVIKVAGLHAGVKNCRKDFAHKVSTAIVKNHDVIAVEGLSNGGLGEARIPRHYPWGVSMCPGSKSYNVTAAMKEVPTVDQSHRRSPERAAPENTARRNHAAGAVPCQAGGV